MDRSYRIHTNIANDACINVNFQQDVDLLEILSLTLKQKDAYRLHSSNYGVIVGRVLANDAFGIPNAKVSVFIEKDGNDSSDVEAIYPYKEVTTKDKEGRRYNILPDYSDDDCYRVVGTFPNKRLMLDDDIQLEVFDKYWKYSTTTNNAGDFMLFAVPTGSVTVHIEMDLSDIGILSQKPRDFTYKGYNLTEFDSPSQFKESTNLDNLAQIFTQNKSIFVYPFWGDSDNGVACITRSDVQIQYKFEPTCVFMGSIVSDNEGHAIGHKCAPDIDSGVNSQLIGGSGTIEMIRKTPDGLIEEYQIQGNQLIDDDGVWCYQIPMNLDYIGTDEYGNVVPTDNPNKGIPTRTQVRFRISKNETGDEGFSRHTAKYLVPMNPILHESSDKLNVKLNSGPASLNGELPILPYKGSELEKMYIFGSSTPISCFRDLYWNNVYSVKNYVPKVQVAHRVNSKNYGALKGANLAEDQNPIPFNKLRIDVPFLYMVVCILYTIMIWVVTVINSIISFLYKLVYKTCLPKILGKKICPLKWIGNLLGDLSCISMSAGSDEGNFAYYPGCSKDAMKNSECPDDMRQEGCEKRNLRNELLDKIQRNLAQEFKIINLDFYQDWVNGCLYMPLWYWRKRRKKTFLFFTLSRAKNDYCSSDSKYSRLKSYVSCGIRYLDNSLTAQNNKNSMPDDEKRWHKNKRTQVRYTKGLIKAVENKDGLTAYYYAAAQPNSEMRNSSEDLDRMPENIMAVRLYATDIILLGNLDPKNIYGIPQFFKCLPSTTANVPPIATIEESPDLDNGNKKEDDLNAAEDSGDTVTTGMDWNHDGNKQFPKYKTGLFMDLACTYVNTRPKSCINVERLSELGVSFDIRHKIPFHDSGTITYGDIDTDGFISKYELDDLENRSMFATLNHVGFVPQEYQDIHDSYQTQVMDRNTNYLVPKFKYIYPVDFDGRLQIPMTLYNTNKNRFKQALFDEKDEAYLTFRLGAEKVGKDGRIRHFYHIKSKDGMYDMPLYNNSFYFYFGINKGKTAIDKFNKEFYSPCTQNSKEPFTLNVTSQGMSYCPSAYDGDCDMDRDNCVGDDKRSLYKYGNLKNNAYAYIRVESDDIRTPYSYVLADSNGNEVISETGMTLDKFVIGGSIDSSGNTVLNCGGVIRYQNNPCLVLSGENNIKITLTNQDYVLSMTDSDGRTVIKRIKLETPKITGVWGSTNLGTKFYDTATSKMSYICNDNTGFYGTISLSGFTIDGYECYVSGVTELSSEPRIFQITGYSEDISQNQSKPIILNLELDVLKGGEDSSIGKCLCGKSGHIEKANKKYYYLGFDADNRVMTIYLYQPNRYSIKMTQECGDGVIASGNASTEIIDVMNGEPFITTLNTMPTKFMLGTADDDISGSAASNSHFYNSSVITEASDQHITGWYGLHQEDTYQFSKEIYRTYNANASTWEDVIYNMDGSVSTPNTKRQILKYKFDKMFKLSEAAYITQGSLKTFTFEATGGVNPILTRCLSPMYEEPENFNKKYVLTEGAETNCIEEFPNIVGKNYSLPNKNQNGYEPGLSGTTNPIFNKVYGGEKNDVCKYVGNYFAAFTRDASYINNSKIDGTHILIERSPSYASISPINSSTPKMKGRDYTSDMGSIKNTFYLAHTKSEPNKQQLTGDIPRYTLPYLRAMYVDRRFDFDLTFLAPEVGSSLSLYPSSSDTRNRIWMSGRVSGWTYNGIEMSYDENYNIISANTHEYKFSSGTDNADEIVYSAATFNKRLEYTYKYDSADICLNCGYQQKGMVSGGTCPHCGGTNISYFAGEIGSCAETGSYVDVMVECVDENGKNPGDEGYTPTYSANSVSVLTIASHSGDTDNFFNGNIETLDNAITYYHTIGNEKYDWVLEDNNRRFAPRWGSWNSVAYNNKTFGFNSSIDEPSGTPLENVPLIKEFYYSNLAGFDIRNLYWSKFNKARLNIYTSSKKAKQQVEGYGVAAIGSLENPFYVYHYPADNDSLYNGDFNRENASTGFTTRRYLDIGNLPMSSFYNYDVGTCSYRMNVDVNDDGSITAETTEGENVELSFNWVSPISIVEPNGSSKDYANVTYSPSKNSISVSGVTYKMFTAGTVSLDFKYNSYYCDNFDVYTKSPRLIQVWPEINGIDGIGYYKTANNIKNKDDKFEFGRYGDGKTLDEAINHITLRNGTFTAPTNISWDLRTLSINIYKSILLPDNVEIEHNYSTKYGTNVDFSGNTVMFRNKEEKELLKSDDPLFTDITFCARNVNLYGEETSANVKVFAVLVDREYQYQDDDNLVRHIRSIETSDLYDCRDLYLGVSSANTEHTVIIDDEPYNYFSGDTYVEMRNEYSESFSAVSNVSSDTGGGIHSDSVEINDTSKVFSQVITFKMRFDASGGTTNNAFSDYNMMSYVFKFKNSKNEEFDVVPSDVDAVTEPDNPSSGQSVSAATLTFVVRWPNNMGILIDSSWNNKASVTLYARTQSNFIYKLANFDVKFIDGKIQSPGEPGDSPSAIKEKMEEGLKFWTPLQLTTKTD